MARQGLMDDTGYKGFEECARHEDCFAEYRDQIRAEAYNDGFYQGATAMEETKQIIIDSLLKQIENVRAEAIDEFAEEIKNLVYKWFESGIINVCTIDKIAEQLKGNK